MNLDILQLPLRLPTATLFALLALPRTLLATNSALFLSFLSRLLQQGTHPISQHSPTTTTILVATSLTAPPLPHCQPQYKHHKNQCHYFLPSELNYVHPQAPFFHLHHLRVSGPYLQVNLSACARVRVGVNVCIRLSALMCR